MDKEYEKVYNWYEKNLDRYAKRSAVLLPDQLGDFIALVPAKGKILDIGCGPGHDTEYFAKKGFAALGGDFSPAMIRYAKNKRQYGKFMRIDMLELAKEFPAGYFDGVWSSSSITHLKPGDITKALRQMKTVAKKNAPIAIIAKAKSRGKKKNRGIIFNDFYKKDIVLLLKKSKLKILKIEKLLTLDTDWWFVLCEK